ATLYQAGVHTPIVAGFVGGLGGRDIVPEEFLAMARSVRAAVNAGANPPPRLLYTAEELQQTQGLQAVALGNEV
ncbi:MAG TPA: pyruvate synthase, partial [bacterium]